MSNYDLDMSELSGEFSRVTEDKKPGAPRKTGTFLDKLVKMPQKDGYVTVRLLPPAPGQKLPYCATRVHNLGTKEKANNVHCARNLVNRKWIGEPGNDCLACGTYSHFWKLADAAEKDGRHAEAEQWRAKARFIKPQERYYYNGVVLDSNPATGQTLADGVLIYSCGITMHTKILEAILGNKQMNKKPKGNIMHPKTGRNLKIVKVMKPGSTYPEYSGSEIEDPSPLSEDDKLIAQLLANLNDLQALRIVLSSEEMKHQIRVYEGLEQDTRMSFDASFLSANGSAPKVQVAVPTLPPALPKRSVDVPVVQDVDEDPNWGVDDDFINSVKSAVQSESA